MASGDDNVPRKLLRVPLKETVLLQTRISVEIFLGRLLTKDVSDISGLVRKLPLPCTPRESIRAAFNTRRMQVKSISSKDSSRAHNSKTIPGFEIPASVQIDGHSFF